MRPRIAIVMFLASLAVLAAAGSAHAAFPGQNGKFAYNVGNLRVVNPDGTGETQLTDPFDPFDNPLLDDMPGWSPDGSRIAFSRICADDEACGGSQIYLIDAHGGPPTLLLSPPGSRNLDPTWSPDGTKLAFTTNRDGNYEIYTMNADGSNQTNTSNSPSTGDEAPAWSPDGTKIAFSRSGDIYTMNVDGSGATQLTTNPYIDTDPSWSPDGQRIAYAGYVLLSDGLTVREEIFVMNASGTNRQNLTNDPQGYDQSPTWSPDGTLIAWSRTPSGSAGHFREISVMKPDGSDKTYLGVQGARSLDWQSLNGSYPAPPYHVPKSASPIKASLVPVFKQCGTGGNPSNSKHASPLAVSSCNPPAPFSNVARVGPASTSSASLGVMPSNPSTAANEADVALEARLTDIQTTAGADYNPNPSGPDLTAYARVRVTDLRSCNPTPCSGPNNKAATTTDTFLSFPVDCVGNTNATVGSSCNANTSANALTPGFAQEGNGTVVQSFRILVDDSGVNGVRGDSDDRIFMMQGVFTP